MEKTNGEQIGNTYLRSALYVNCNYSSTHTYHHILPHMQHLYSFCWPFHIFFVLSKAMTCGQKHHFVAYFLPQSVCLFSIYMTLSVVAFAIRNMCSTKKIQLKSIYCLLLLLLLFAVTNPPLKNPRRRWF